MLCSITKRNSLLGILVFVFCLLTSETAADMLPYGVAAGDTNLAFTCDDCFTSAISITGNIPFFNTTYNKFFVSANGLISFHAGISAYSPVAFPVASQPCMCAYWADLDFRSGTPGSFYRIIYGPTSMDTRIAESFGGTFTSQISIIVTWANVGYYSSRIDKLNTLQLELHTDGRSTFVCFNYPTNGINWTTGDASGGSGGLGGTPAQVGFDAGDGV